MNDIIDPMVKLEALSPKMNTIHKAVETEEIVYEKLKELCLSGEIDPRIVQCYTNISKEIGKLRINQRSQVSVTARIIKDITKDPEEFKMYIEASMPKSFKLPKSFKI